MALLLLPWASMAFRFPDLALVCIVFSTSGAGCFGASKLINVAAAEQGAVAIADSEFGGYSADRVIDGTTVGPKDAWDVNRWHSAPAKAYPHWIWIRLRE